MSPDAAAPSRSAGSWSGQPRTINSNFLPELVTLDVGLDGGFPGGEDGCALGGRSARGESTGKIEEELYLKGVAAAWTEAESSCMGLF